MSSHHLVALLSLTGCLRRGGQPGIYGQLPPYSSMLRDCPRLANRLLHCVSALSEQEHIRVRLASRGCFHDFEHEFVFTPATGGAAGLSHSSRRENLVDGARFVAPSHLSASALAELDAVIAYFRAPAPLPNGRRCRADETVELSLFRGGLEVAMERFVGTCGSWDDEALTFGRLLRIEREIAGPPPNQPRGLQRDRSR